MRHRRARRQLLGQPREIRRGLPAPRRMPHVVAQHADREHPPPPAGFEPGRGVQREHVEGDGVAGFYGPAEDVVGRAVGLDVGQVGQRALGEPPGLVGHEGARHQPRPLVRAGDKLQRRGTRHRIHRNPEADVLAALDVVVGLVLVPGRALARARFLGEHVVVIEPHLRAPREPGRGGRQCRARDHVPVRRDLLPVAEVLDEEARIVGPARHLRAHARRGEIGIDALAQQLDLGGAQDAAQHDGAVARKFLDLLFRWKSVVGSCIHGRGLLRGRQWLRGRRQSRVRG